MYNVQCMVDVDSVNDVKCVVGVNSVNNVQCMVGTNIVNDVQCMVGVNNVNNVKCSVNSVNDVQGIVGVNRRWANGHLGKTQWDGWDQDQTTFQNVLTLQSILHSAYSAMHTLKTSQECETALTSQY